MPKVIIGFKKLADDIPLPKKMRNGDAGYDVACAEEFCIDPGQVVNVKTGLIPDIPDGYEIQVRPRGGLAANQGITVLNTPGTVDQNYKGEIFVILINHGKNPVCFDRLSRIAQFVVAKTIDAELNEIEHVSSSERGDNALSSSGV